MCANAVSQVSTRLITFALNLATARLLSVASYGVRCTCLMLCNMYVNSKVSFDQLAILLQTATVFSVHISGAVHTFIPSVCSMLQSCASLFSPHGSTSYLRVSLPPARQATCIPNSSQAWSWVPDRGVSAQLASVQFHLINTAILFLSREGFRRGCLRSEQDGGAVHVPRLLATAALVLPVGAVTAAATCGLMLRRHGPAEPGDPYPTAVYMQGADQLHGGVR